MFDDITTCLMNECYDESGDGQYHLLSALEGGYISRLKELSKAGLVELRVPSPSAQTYGVSYEARLTPLGISKWRASQEGK